jgi:sialidase-1
MTYGSRRPPYGNQARVSEDGGRTWSAPMTISADGAGGDLGYPSSVQLADGSLLSVWYESKKGYRGAVLRQARWKLEG